MEITPKFDFVKGSFNTKECRLECVVDDNHGKVDLCIKEPNSNWLIPIGKIILHSKDLYVDFKSTLSDAKLLGDEICRRWNECTDKK